jgi:hypothetical protein
MPSAQWRRRRLWTRSIQSPTVSRAAALVGHKSRSQYSTLSVAQKDWAERCPNTPRSGQPKGTGRACGRIAPAAQRCTGSLDRRDRSPCAPIAHAARSPSTARTRPPRCATCRCWPADHPAAVPLTDRAVAVRMGSVLRGDGGATWMAFSYRPFLELCPPLVDRDVAICPRAGLVPSWSRPMLGRATPIARVSVAWSSSGPATSRSAQPVTAVNPTGRRAVPARSWSGLPGPPARLLGPRRGSPGLGVPAAEPARSSLAGRYRSSRPASVPKPFTRSRVPSTTEAVRHSPARTDWCRVKRIAACSSLSATSPGRRCGTNVSHRIDAMSTSLSDVDIASDCCRRVHPFTRLTRRQRQRWMGVSASHPMQACPMSALPQMPGAAVIPPRARRWCVRRHSAPEVRRHYRCATRRRLMYVTPSTTVLFDALSWDPSGRRSEQSTTLSPASLSPATEAETERAGRHISGSRHRLVRLQRRTAE